MSKYLEGMSEYDKGFVDGNRAKEALQAELKAQIEREARHDELERLEYIDFGEDINPIVEPIIEEYINIRIKELESE